MSNSRIVPCLVLVVAAVFPRDARADLIHEELDTSMQACSEDSQVVGYRKCRSYGEWSVDADELDVFVSYGTSYRHLGTTAVAPIGRAAKASPASSSTSSPAGGKSIDAVVIVERVGVMIGPGAYLAFEAEMGNFAAGDEAATHDIIVGGLGAFGLRGNLGVLALGAEIGLGYRGYSEPDVYDLIGEPILEARGRADLWLTPWFTVGAVAGSSLLDRGEWLAGISLGFHTHAYSGTR